MVDHFVQYPADRTMPATGGFTVVPDDNEDFAVRPRAIWVGGEGDIRMILPGFEEDSVSDPETVTITNVQNGTLLPISPSRILATGTTATNIVGLY